MSSAPTLMLVRGRWHQQKAVGPVGKPDPSLVITAFAATSMPIEAPQRATESAGINHSSTTLDAYFNGKSWAVSGALFASGAGPLLSIPGAALIQSNGGLPELFDTTILFVAKPWTEILSAPLPTREGRRTLVIAASGLLDSTWCDGPLAHVLPDGRVASLVPEGAGASGIGGCTTLTLTPSLWEEAEVSAVTPAASELCRGSLGERARRCAAAHLAAVLAARRQTPNGDDAGLSINTFDVQSAIALALVRPHLRSTSVPLRTAVPWRDVPHAWRRFAEHTGYRFMAESKATGDLPVSALRAAIPEFLTADLRAAVNSPSDVLPPSLC